jgi:hypothetical protein
MTTCAVINSENQVVNLIMAEPTDIAPNGCTLIVSPDESGNFAQLGGAWDGTQFISVVTDEVVADSEPITDGS